MQLIQKNPVSLTFALGVHTELEGPGLEERSKNGLGLSVGTTVLAVASRPTGGGFFPG